jgi:hypothetical protein
MKYSFTFKFNLSLDIRLIHIALYAPRRKKRDKLTLIKWWILYNTPSKIILFYIDFIFFYIHYAIDFFYFFFILEFVGFLLLLWNLYFLKKTWNNICENWKPFGSEKILMISWVVLFRIPNLCYILPTSNYSSTLIMSVKEPF